MKNKQKMYRVTLDFPKSKTARINNLQSECSANTKAQLFKMALTLMAWICEQQKAGGKVVVIDRHGKEREVVFPLWTRANTSPTDDHNTHPETRTTDIL